MATGIQIKGLDKFIGKMEDLASETREDMQLALNNFGEAVVGDAKQLVASNSSDEGHLLGSISYSKGDLSVTIVAAVVYAAFIEFGTRKFAAEYVATLPQDWASYASSFRNQGGSGSFDEFLRRIMEWVKRKGIEEKAAYPIARSILINGIRAKPFLYPSVNKNLPILKDDLKAIFE